MSNIAMMTSAGIADPIANAAAAQSLVNVPTDAPAETPGGKVITARLRQKRLAHVPMGITAINGAALTNDGHSASITPAMELPMTLQSPHRVSAAAYHLIDPVPQMPRVAAQVDEIDLSQPLTASLKAELHHALPEFEVLPFAPCVLTPERHIELASGFEKIASGACFPRMS